MQKQVYLIDFYTLHPTYPLNINFNFAAILFKQKKTILNKFSKITPFKISYTIQLQRLFYIR